MDIMQVISQAAKSHQEVKMDPLLLKIINNTNMLLMPTLILPISIARPNYLIFQVSLNETSTITPLMIHRVAIKAI